MAWCLVRAQGLYLFTFIIIIIIIIIIIAVILHMLEFFLYQNDSNSLPLKLSVHARARAHAHTHTHTKDVSKSFRTGRLERELQVVQPSVARYSFIAILWVSLVSFAVITLYVAS
jgi:hypothetical protein